jgi:hypothetical protein
MDTPAGFVLGELERLQRRLVIVAPEPRGPGGRLGDA